jgi:hypothetical protein
MDLWTISLLKNRNYARGKHTLGNGNGKHTRSHLILLVHFLFAAKISNICICECVPLCGANIVINVSKWSDELLAAGKLSTIWVKTRCIHMSLKIFHEICDVG